MSSVTVVGIGILAVWLLLGLVLTVAYLGMPFMRLLGSTVAHGLVAIGLMWRPATGPARWRWQR